MCFIVAAYFPVQVLVLVFVKVITLTLKLLHEVCCNQLLWLLELTGAQPFAQSVGSTAFWAVTPPSQLK